MSVALPAVAVAETLADTLIAAYQNSNLLEQNRAVLRAADEDVAQAIAALRPTLDFIADFDYLSIDGEGTNPANPDFNPLDATFQLVLQWAIFDGGTRSLNRELQRETVLATREQLVEIEQDVFSSAVNAFFTVLRAVAFVDLRENNVRLIGEELQAAQDRFEVGEVTRTDVALAESRLAQARSELAGARGDLDVAREEFRAAVGRYPGNLQVPSSLPATARTVDDAVAVAIQRHPSIRRSQRQVTVADIGVEIATRAYAPSVTFDARAGTDVDGEDRSSVGISLSQRIYQGGGLASAERQAIAQRDQARAGLHQTTLLIAQQVGSAWARVQAAQIQIVATNEQIRAAEIAFEGTREEARLGARTTLDVLDSEQDLLDARTARVDAIATQYVAIYQLLSAMGLLTVEHLNLGIQTYDPVAYYNAVDSAPARNSRQGEQLDRVLRRIGRE